MHCVTGGRLVATAERQGGFHVVRSVHRRIYSTDRGFSLGRASGACAAAVDRGWSCGFGRTGRGEGGDPHTAAGFELAAAGRQLRRVNKGGAYRFQTKLFGARMLPFGAGDEMAEIYAGHSRIALGNDC